MLRLDASHRVLGPAAIRSKHPLRPPDPQCEQRAWYVDAEHAVVAGLWREGVLWLAGDVVEQIVDGVVEPLSLEAAPPLPVNAPLRWTKLEPRAGVRYVARAGAAHAPGPGVGEREPLLDAMFDIPAAPTPGVFARLLGKRPAVIEASALVIDVVEEPEPQDLTSWLARLQARGIDLSWAGNEAGPGLVQVFHRPLPPDADVEAALLEHAREDAELTTLMRECTEPWIEDGGVPPEDGRLVPDDPSRGWIERLTLDAIIGDVRGSTGSYLDPGTAHARSCESYVLPGAAIVQTLQSLLEQPRIVAVHSAPEEAVLAIHLIGGIDRASGELVGFALQRVWT